MMMIIIDDDGADGDDSQSDNEDDSEASGDGSSCMMYRHDGRSRSRYRDKHRHPYNLDRICASVASYQPNSATISAFKPPRQSLSPFSCSGGRQTWEQVKFGIA